MWFNKLWVLLDLGNVSWHFSRFFAVLEAVRKRFSGNVIKEVEVDSYMRVEESGVLVGTFYSRWLCSARFSGL